MTWEQRILGSLAVEVQTGFASGKHAGDGDVLHLRPMNITPLGTLTLDGGKFVAANAGAQRVVRGDVLFNNTNSPKWVGKTAYVNSNQELAFSNHMTRLRTSDDRIDPKFLATYLHYQQSLGYFQEICSNHVNQASVSRKALLQTVVPLPPLAEQHRIVGVLEAHLSRLDAAEATLSTARANAQRIRAQAIETVLKRVTISRQGESAADRLSAIAQRRSAMVPRRKATPIPPAYPLDLPPGFVTASVDQLCWSIQYGTSTKAHDSPVHGDVPVFRMGNIQDGELDTSHLKFIAADDPTIGGLLLEPGDILFNRTNSAELVGKTAVFHRQLATATFASYLIRARVADGVAPDWISLIVNSSIGRRYIETVMSQQVGQANVNGKKLAAMPIPVATAKVEQALLSEATELRAAAARLCTEIDRAADQAVALRRSLLRSAFAGELVDRDPPDVPIPETLAESR